MKLILSAATVFILLAKESQVAAFSPSKNSQTVRFSSYASLTSDHRLSMTAEAETEMDYAAVNKLAYRELQSRCKDRGLAANGNTAALRCSLLEDLGLLKGDEDCDIVDDYVDASVVEDFPTVEGIDFQDEADHDFDFKVLISEIEEKTSVGHWKAATRKLKKLNKSFATPERPVPQETYIAVLEACLANRLQGARASEPARKILEQMAEDGYTIPASLGNQCVLNCLGNGPNGSHDGCGGIDTALAMLAAMESSASGSQMINVDSYGAVASALCMDGAVEEACLLLRAMVVEHSFTPPLSTFSDVAHAAAKSGDKGETVLQVLSLAKASGYLLDNIASAVAGRELLASGVIAAEQIDNLALGLRLLTAAAKAEGCAPDRGDALVASTSSASQRACTLIHRRAIDTAIKDDNWKLAVKLKELMIERSLTPSTAVLRRVVGVCTKMEKSKKATALLLDWINRAEEGHAEKPPLSVFNNVVNACEICGEEELTLVVLEAMKKLHESEGNTVTTNIALKRLAKQGNLLGVEGLIIGMLQAEMEPTVVTYTTAIGACVKAEDSAMAYEWLKRMRSRNVTPNLYTYNTALAACLDGKLESTIRGSTIATEMMEDVQKELTMGLKGNAEYTSVIPDSYTKVLARSLMKQLKKNWRAGDINMQVAKSTVRVPLLKLVDFDKSEAAAEVQKQKEALTECLVAMEEDAQIDCEVLSQELTGVIAMVKAHRTMEV
jgi:pentatricopeptide repeat protein